MKKFILFCLFVILSDLSQAQQNILSNQTVSGSVAESEWKQYIIRSVSFNKNLTVNLSGSGDADLYVKKSSVPSLSSYDCRPYLNSSNESCSIANTGSTDWYIGVRGYHASEFTLIAALTPQPLPPPQDNNLSFVPTIISLLLTDDEVAPPVDNGKSYLNDTGFYFAGLLSGFGTAPNNTCPTSSIYLPQDCHFGRDKEQPTIVDGRNGFSFTKLDATGNELSAGASNAKCIRDNVTGFIWELKTNDGGIHDMDHAYYWYSTASNNNGGNVGQIGEGGLLDDGPDICFGYTAGQSSTFCNTQAFVNRVNQEELCGISSWKLPSREQLRSLVDYSVSSSLSQPKAKIDESFFPNTLTNTRSNYWSSSPRGGASWGISFFTGQAGVVGRHQSSLVRLVH